MKLIALLPCTILAAALFTAFPALAESTIHSVEAREFTVVPGEPLGPEHKVRVSRALSSTANSRVRVQGKTQAITIVDETGAKIYDGKIDDDMHYLLHKGAGGYTLLPAGRGTGPRDAYHGVVVVSLLPDKIGVDMLGASGSFTKKDVPVGTSFEAVKGATMLSPDDSRYNVYLTLPDGTREKAHDQGMPGRYHVIHRTYDGKVTMSPLGYIAK